MDNTEKKLFQFLNSKGVPAKSLSTLADILKIDPIEVATMTKNERNRVSQRAQFDVKKLWADSPYDLGSIGDNGYRDGIDAVLQHPDIKVRVTAHDEMLELLKQVRVFIGYEPDSEIVKNFDRVISKAEGE